MRVLVLGAYGFIGIALARALRAAGHEVTGLGRDPAIGPRVLPGIDWVCADLARLRTAGDWSALLAKVDAVVNAAGALQEGPRDDLERLHHVAIASLAEACAAAGAIRLVQVSAPGARTDATTDFMRTKARAEAAIRRSGGDWVILRPGLVLGAQAWGGSALLRTLAAFPLVQPIALPDKRVQCVALDDVARVVLEAVEGSLGSRTEFDLVENAPHRLREVVAKIRAWLGVPPARAEFVFPEGLVALVSRLADALGRLGWRSPLRATAVRALEAEVIGDPAPLEAHRGRPLASLDELLAARPAGAQERVFARLQLLLPALVATLAAFWIASGLVGLADVARAARTLPESAVPAAMAKAFVVTGALVDIALGLAVLRQPWARAACGGMVVVSGFYLAAGTVLTPGLWLDPLGPFVKVVPAALAAVVAAVLLEER